jgi:hypothetical protein
VGQFCSCSCRYLWIVIDVTVAIYGKMAAMSVPQPTQILLAPLVGPAIALVFLLGGSRISGWSALVRRFRAPQPWSGEKWSWQSAKFRAWFGYNNCLRVGADSQSLSLAMMPFFHLPFHPALLIPWSEIEIETGRVFFGLYERAKLRIGSEERIPVIITGKLVARLRQAAGPAWPLDRIEQWEGNVSN